MSIHLTQAVYTKRVNVPHFFSPIVDPYLLMHRAEEEVLRDILKNLLNREPTPEDTKNLSLIYKMGDRMNYEVAYLGVHVGSVTKEFHPDTPFRGISVSIIFTPKKNFK